MAQNPERTIKEMTSLDLNQQPLCIEYPTLDVDFELKSGLIHLLPTFRGLAGEDPHKHLKEFHVVCSGMRPQGVTEEQVKLRAFPFSLGLSETNRSLVDAASGGALYDKTPTEARKLITIMAANNQQFGNRSDNPPRKVNEVSISVDERLDKLTSLVERLIVGNTQQVKACGICTSSGHATNACPTLHEECTMHANAVGGFSRPPQRGHDHFSNTYNPEWRDYPKLRYGDQPQNFQRPPYQQPPPPPQANTNSGMPLEDIVKTLALSTQQFQQETRASIQNLESQMSQLASSVSRLESQGKLPSQTIINPKQNVSAITLCSEKELQLENSTRRGHAEHGKTGEELKIPPNQVERSELTQEEHPKVFVPRPPFPEQFAKSKKEEDDKEIFETLSKVEVNIPLLDAIKQVPRYAKFLKEMCTNKSKLREKAMCDLGASINVMPLSIYGSLNIGPLKETYVVLQLADRSIVYPEGVLEDVLVQVNELIFPADFYVINMMDNSPNFTSILLGRPFLKTSKTKIDVDAGILSMEFDNEVVSFSIGYYAKFS
ncbi:UNVERIFIED_CONTAM: hypothetical protein Sradi_1878900 [Sesamum radiatum]|uniref:Retrotransposon gag protein n=1 Tax=Sesamum radiatum TaxID=300843 RepID=A0AAW2TWW6_SESRA